MLFQKQYSPRNFLGGLLRSPASGCTTQRSSTNLKTEATWVGFTALNHLFHLFGTTNWHQCIIRGWMKHNDTLLNWLICDLWYSCLKVYIMERVGRHFCHMLSHQQTKTSNKSKRKDYCINRASIIHASVGHSLSCTSTATNTLWTEKTH